MLEDLDRLGAMANPGQVLMWGFPKIRGYLFDGPHNKDYSILGSTLGFPLFWEIVSYSLNSFKGGYIGDYIGFRV